MQEFTQLLGEIFRGWGPVRGGRRLTAGETQIVDEIERLRHCVNALLMEHTRVQNEAERTGLLANLLAVEAELHGLGRRVERENHWRVMSDVEQLARRLREVRPTLEASAPAQPQVITPEPPFEVRAPRRPHPAAGPVFELYGGDASSIMHVHIILMLLAGAVGVYLVASLQQLLVWLVGGEVHDDMLPLLGRFAAAGGGAFLTAFIFNSFRVTQRPAICLPLALLGGIISWFFAFEWFLWFFTF